MVRGFATRLTTSYAQGPWSFKLLILVSLLYWAITGIVAILTGDTLRIALLPGTPVFLVLWLLRLRWWWWLMAVGGAIALVTLPLEGRSGWLIAWTAFTLVLVCWPSTYTYVTRRPLPAWVANLGPRHSSNECGPEDLG